MTFLLSRPEQVQQDGFIASYAPFMIHYDGTDVYAAFESPTVALYFARRVGLNKEYTPVPLPYADSAAIKDAQHALVLKNRAEVDRLLAGKLTGSTFTQNLLRLR